MAEKQTKTWCNYSAAYRSRLVRQMSESLLSKTSTTDEAVEFLLAIVKHMDRGTDFCIGQKLLSGLQSKTPEQTSIHPTIGQKLLQNLADLRQRVANHHSQYHLPRMSANDLDTCVVLTGLQWEALQQVGYKITRNQILAISTGQPQVSRVGRPKKVSNEELISKIRGFLANYLDESSKVVTVRKNGKKELVCAKLLAKKSGRIWKEEPDLRKVAGLTLLRRMVRLHFPSYRPPGRKTDVCGHCRIFKKHIIPRAQKEYNKRRAIITAVVPNYFEDFDKAPEVVQSCSAARMDELVLGARKYIEARNARSARDVMRDGLSRAQRLELHEHEARACHKLKGHCELIQAYSWHKLSADRQREFSTNLLNNLPPTEAYMHFDFKENVRYPMAKEETGDEWHAQNKLSLTVFGCTVYTPGRANMNFLLVSEVLDHDSQMARLLLSHVINVVKTRPAYEWNKVQKLHLVCDCGPHFRSRESYAFYLHDLPKDLQLPASWPSSFVYAVKVIINSLSCPPSTSAMYRLSQKQQHF